MVKFFGVSYKESFEEEKVAKAVRKLASAPDTHVKLKAIDVLEKFKFKQADSTENIQSLISSFDPNGSPLTKMKILDKISADISRDDDYEKLVVEKTTILKLLSSCLADVSTVIRDKADTIISALRAVSRQQLADAGILEVWRGMLLNRKLQQEYQDRTLTRLIPYFAEVGEQVEKAGLIPVVAAIIGDDSFTTKARLLAVDVAQKLDNRLFQVCVINPGVLVGMLKWADGSWEDAVQQYELLTRCLAWGTRALEIELAAISSAAPTTDSASGADSPKDGKVQQQDKLLADYSSILLPICARTDQLAADHRIHASHIMATTSSDLAHMLGVFKTKVDVTHHLINLLSKIICTWTNSSVAIEFHGQKGVTLLAELNGIYTSVDSGTGANISPNILKIVVELGRMRVLGEDVPAVLGDENCIALLQQTVPKEGADFSHLPSQINRVLSWLLLWKILVPHQGYATLFLDLGGLMCLSKLLMGSVFSTEVRTGAGDVLAQLLTKDEILQRVLPDKDLFRSLSEYLDLVMWNSSASILRLLRQLIVSPDNLATFCRADGNISKVLTKTDQCQWDRTPSGREVRNCALDLIGYWLANGSNVANVKIINAVHYSLSQLLDFDHVEPENFDAACAIVHRFMMQGGTWNPRDSLWSNNYAYRYENICNQQMQLNRQPSAGFVLLSRVAAQISASTQRPGPSGTVNHLVHLITSIGPNLPKIDMVEACKARAVARIMKLDNLSEEDAERKLSEKKATDNSVDLKKSRKKDKGKEKEADDEESSPTPAASAVSKDEEEPRDPPPPVATVFLEKKLPREKKAERKLSRVIRADYTGDDLMVLPIPTAPPFNPRNTRYRETGNPLRKQLPPMAARNVGRRPPRQPRARRYSSSSSSSSSDASVSLPVGISDDESLSVDLNDDEQSGSFSDVSTGSSIDSPDMDPELHALLKSLDNGSSSSASLASPPQVLDKAVITPEVQSAFASGQNRKYVGEVLEMKLFDRWPGATVVSVLFDSFPMMTVRAYFEEIFFCACETLSHLDFKTMASYTYSSLLNALNRLDALSTAGTFGPTPATRSSICRLIGKLYPTMGQRDKTSLGLFGGMYCGQIFKYSDDASELVAALKAAGTLQQTAEVKEFVQQPVFKDILASATAEARLSSEKAISLCEFIQAVASPALEQVGTAAIEAVKLVLGVYGDNAKALTAAINLLEFSSTNIQSVVEADPDFLKLLLSTMAKNKGVQALDKTGLVILRNLAGPSLDTLDDYTLADLVTGLWKRISPGGSSEVMREASTLLVQLLARNKDRVLPAISKFDIWADLHALYAGAQHIYLIPVAAAVARASSDWTEATVGLLLTKFRTLAAVDHPLIYRLLVVLFGTAGAKVKSGMDFVALIGPAIANANLAIGTALDVMEFCYLVADEANKDTNSASWGQIQAKLVQVLNTWNFHQYSFYFTLFTQKISPRAAVNPWIAPRSVVYIEESTPHILMDRDCLTFGCNQPSLESVIANKSAPAGGVVFFSLSTRILPSWCTLQVGFATKSAWKAFDPSKSVGVGNVAGSYGYDPLNFRMYNCGAATPVPNTQRFYQGHVVWCFLDMNRKTISFKTPTSDHPDAITGVDLSEPLFPCVSIDSDANVALKFDAPVMQYGSTGLHYVAIS